MRIRIINEKDWEKSYELDKSIIRVGSQITCDIMISDPDVPPLMMQITRSGTIDIRNTMRFFTENITLTRGDQTFPPDMNMPYEVLDGDKINFSRYRMIIELESDKSRVRQTEHMRAEMFLSDRDLAPDSPISGGLLLKNLGTQRPCQFRLNIKGIPAECLYSSPLPYLHPGASSSVGFTISHLKTRPAPGFHTVSITLSAPDDYYGEMLEFNQDIYVYPVFDNVMILEDDTDKLSGMVRKDDNGKENPLPEPVTVQPDISVRDSGMMNLDESVFASNASPDTGVRVLGKENTAQNPSFEEEDEEEELPGYRRKRERVVVIHSDDENLFDGESPEEQKPAEEAVPETAPAEVPGGEPQTDPADSTPGRPSSQEQAPAPVEKSAVNQPQPSESSKRQKVSEPENAAVPEEPREAPVSWTNPVKFKPDAFVVYSGKKDAFDEEPEEQAPAEEPAPETGKDGETASPDEAGPAPEKKARTKSAAKEEMTQAEAEAVPLTGPESEKSILVLDSSPAEQEDVPEETAPAEEPETEKQFPEEEPVSEEVPAEEPGAEKRSPEEEAVPEETAPAEEPAEEKQFPEEEAVPEEAAPAAEIQSPNEEQEPKEDIPEREPSPVSDEEAEAALPEEPKAAPMKKTRKKNPAKEPAAEEKPSVEDKAPAEEPPAEGQTSEAEISLISEKEAEKASADEVMPAPVKKQRKKSAAKQQENPQPEEQPSTEEMTPEATPPAEEMSAEEGPFGDEPVPEETLPAEEPTAEEGPFGDEPVPGEILPAEETAAEEGPSVGEPVPGETLPVEETTAEEGPSVDEPVPGEILPAEETAAEEGPFMEEPVPGEILPAEETAAEEGPFMEEQVPEEEPKVENPVPEKKLQIPVFRHSAGFDEFSTGETGDPDHLDGEPSETQQEKPAVRVVKGGGFD